MLARGEPLIFILMTLWEGMGVCVIGEAGALPNEKDIYASLSEVRLPSAYIFSTEGPGRASPAPDNHWGKKKVPMHLCFWKKSLKNRWSLFLAIL